MTKRERVLLAAVVVTLLFVGGLYVANKVGAMFAARDTEIDTLLMKTSDLELSIDRGNRARRKLNDYDKRSLPSDLDFAEAEYLKWLEKKVHEIGFEGRRDVTGGPRRPVGDVYHQHVFSVNGRVDLNQLVRFLYEFHTTDLLHRIGNLTVKPVNNSKRLLDVQITIHALSMKSAEPRKPLDPKTDESLVAMDLESYRNAIVGRNLFSVANKPPQITSSTRQSGYTGRPISFTVSATDPDNDEVTYHLEGDAPEGLSIDENSGNVRFSASEVGEVKLTVRATDRGVPAKSVTQDITLAITEPPPPPPPTPPKPGFDVATQAVLTGITESAGQRLAWVTVKTEGKVMWVAEGDKISVGSVTGVLKKLTNSDAEIETEGGDVIKVRIGKSLREQSGEGTSAAGG